MSLNTNTQTAERVGCAGSTPGGQCGSSEPRPSCAPGRQSGPAPQTGALTPTGTHAANEGQPGTQSRPHAPLSKRAAARLKRLEQSNRSRARKASVPVAAVDFIAALQAQNWACCICGDAMDPELIVTGPAHTSVAISLEHQIPIGVGGGHVPGNVKGAHMCCNLKKGNATDTTSAAKVKRMQAKHAPIEKELCAPQDKPAKGKSRLQSGGFDRTFKRTIASPNRPGKTVRRETSS